MNGYFDVRLLDSCGMNDYDVVEYIKYHGVDELCKKLSLKGRYNGCNRVFDSIPARMLNKLFGAPSLWSDFPLGFSTFYSLDFLNISSIDTDTDSYTETSNNSIDSRSREYVSDISGSVDNDNGSIFLIDGAVESSILVHGDADKIIFTSRVLFMPSEIISSNINSLVIGATLYNSGWNWYVLRVARIRLKDAEGNLVTMTKSDRDVLLIEYQFTMSSG
jgi:hypothetical protein